MMHCNTCEKTKNLIELMMKEGPQYANYWGFTTHLKEMEKEAMFSQGWKHYSCGCSEVDRQTMLSFIPEKCYFCKRCE